MKLQNLATLVVFIAPAAFADSAKFTTPAAQGTVRTTEELTLTGARAYVYCRFEDGSGAGGETKTQAVETTLTEVPNAADEAGRAYKIAVKSTVYSQRKFLTALQQCGYYVEFDGKTAEAEGPIEGSVTLTYQFTTKRETYKEFVDTLEAKVKAGLANIRLKSHKGGVGYLITENK